MLIILKKKVGTNQWHYPDTPTLFTDQFPNPNNNQELIVENNSGKTLTQLSDDAGYDIVTYTGSTPAAKPSLISMAVFGELLPDAVLINLEDIKNDTGQSSSKRQAAMRVLTRINSNVEVDVNHDDFSTLLAQLVQHAGLTQTKAEEILNNLQNR